MAPGELAAITEVLVRRYRCQRCGAVSWTAPGDVLPRYLYSGPAMGWALALFCIANFSVSRVRGKVCVWRRAGASAHGRWTTLRRWLRKGKHGDLFGWVPWRLAAGCARMQLRPLATALAARAPPDYESLPLHDRSFYGARAM